VARLRVVVVGAGIGGLALARGLVQEGHEVIVLEKAPALRTSGAAISVWFNGMEALRRLGVSPDGLGQRIDRLVLRRPQGRLLAAIDAAKLAGRFGVEAATVPRRVVLERLAEGLPDGVVRFGAECKDVELDPGRPRVTLADGTVVDGDLVVGADGWRSVVRAALGADEPVRYLGVGAWQMLVQMPASLSASHDFLYLIGAEGRAGFMAAGAGLFQSWFDVPWTEGAPRPDSVRSLLSHRFASWPSPVPEVLAAATEDDIELWHYAHRRVPESLGRGRVVLVGDAAHTMPPYLAQGANQALEDAWILTTQLRSSADPAHAVRTYGDKRRRKAAAVSHLAVSSLAGGQLRWLDRVTPAGGLPIGLSTALYGYFIRAASSVLGLTSTAP